MALGSPIPTLSSLCDAVRHRGRRTYRAGESFQADGNGSFSFLKKKKKKMALLSKRSCAQKQRQTATAGGLENSRMQPRRAMESATHRRRCCVPIIPFARTKGNIVDSSRRPTGIIMMMGGIGLKQMGLVPNLFIFFVQSASQGRSVCSKLFW